MNDTDIPAASADPAQPSTSAITHVNTLEVAKDILGWIGAIGIAIQRECERDGGVHIEQVKNLARCVQYLAQSFEGDFDVQRSALLGAPQ